MEEKTHNEEEAVVNSSAEVLPEETVGTDETVIEPQVNETETDDGSATVPVEVLIEEAERRGYLRGLNEQASRMMSRPMEGERPQSADESAGSHEPEIMILDRRRVSVWDR